MISSGVLLYKNIDFSNFLFHVHLDNLCPFFMVDVKRQNMSHKSLIFLASNFVFLHSLNEKSTFHWRTLCARSMWRCTHEFFVWNLLTFEKVSKMHFKMKGSYAPKNQNITRGNSVRAPGWARTSLFKQIRWVLQY
jgi:hypothetical protein